MNDLTEYIPDDELEKIGFTKETFKGSRVEALLEVTRYGIEKIIQEETQRLMREHNLSYGEARSIVTDAVLNTLKYRLKDD